MEIIVHGGAGRIPDTPDERVAVLELAAETGSMASTPVAAVTTAIKHLEASPRFNAGVGSARQSDGIVRTDAGIMTATHDVGAACSLRGVKHAISVADAVRTETPHILLAGESAVEFADSMGIDTHTDLTTQRTDERWEQSTIAQSGYDEQLTDVRERFGKGSDTVGAVATDGESVVAGTSTGGRWVALAGRVGDVPQVGCGFYASSAGAASTTGAGEDIARYTLAREAVRELEMGASPEDAAATVIDNFDRNTGSSAGIIVCDNTGAVGDAYCSEAMQTAVAVDGGIRSP